MTIGNEHYLLEIRETDGAIARLYDRKGNIEFITEPKLAESFRLLLPIPDLEANYISGANQEKPEIRKSETGAVLHWRGPLTGKQGSYELDVALTIDCADEEIRFSCSVKNGSRYPLAEVWFAWLGGMTGFGRGAAAKDAEILVPFANSAWNQRIFKDFGNTRGQLLGCSGGEHGFCYPGMMSMPWVSFFSRKQNRGFYFAALEEPPRVKMIRLALEPGVGTGRPAGNWPRKGETGNFPSGLIANWVQFPYTRPGSTFTSATVVLRVHEGGWRKSAEFYRKWFTERYPVIKPGSTWIRRETATVHTMFMLPEDNINLFFKDIPHWAKEAKGRGINHVMIAGWNIGGHDRGYPYYEPDRRLGTWEQLQSGIRAIHDLGMKVSFFVNCQPVDMTTRWYKDELHKYVIRDPHGQPYFICNYWGMGTLSARTRFFTGTPFVEVNPKHPAVRHLLTRQFMKLVEIGADGLHIDKFFNTPMDFNPLLTESSPDRANHEGMLEFVEELFSACRRINPDFCISYEGGWDRLMPYSETSWWGPADCVLKEVFPNRTLTGGVEQPYDYNKVNLAVLNGDNLLIGPANYTRGMDYPPMQNLFSYIKEVTRIRRQFFDVVCLGRRIDSSYGLFRGDTKMLRIEGKFAENPNCRWSVFEDTQTGRRGIILANLDWRPVKAEEVLLEGQRTKKYLVCQPFEKPVPGKFPLSISVPGETVAFVIEAL